MCGRYTQSFTAVCCHACCLAERVHHVTLPPQPLISQSEGLLNLSSPASVTVLSPDGSTVIFQVTYKLIRRLGCKVTAGADIVWFETCKDSRPDQFVFFVVSSGTAMAQHIVRELKLSIEQHIGVFLILEEAESQDSLDISFISREHYGCEEFTMATRARILQSGLSHYHPICCSSCLDTPPPASPVAARTAASGSVPLDAWGRHRSVSTANIIGRRTTLLDLHHSSLGSTASSHNSVEGLDSNIFSDAFESPPGTSSPRTSSPRGESPRVTSPRAGSPITSSPQRHMRSSTSSSSMNVLSVNVKPRTERFRFMQSHSVTRQTQSTSNVTSSGPTVPPRSANSLRGEKEQ